MDEDSIDLALLVFGAAKSYLLYAYKPGAPTCAKSGLAEAELGIVRLC